MDGSGGGSSLVSSGRSVQGRSSGGRTAQDQRVDGLLHRHRRAGSASIAHSAARRATACVRLPAIVPPCGSTSFRRSGAESPMPSSARVTGRRSLRVNASAINSLVRAWGNRPRQPVGHRGAVVAQADAVLGTERVDVPGQGLVRPVGCGEQHPQGVVGCTTAGHPPPQKQSGFKWIQLIADHSPLMVRCPFRAEGTPQLTPSGNNGRSVAHYWCTRSRINSGRRRAESAALNR